MSPLTQGPRVAYLSLRPQDTRWSRWARLTLEAQFSSLSGVPWYPFFSLGTRGSLRPRESRGALQSREALFSRESWGPVLAHITLGAWLSCGPRLPPFSTGAGWSSFAFLPLLARLPSLAFLAQRPQRPGKSNRALRPWTPWITWETRHAKIALLPSCAWGPLLACQPLRAFQPLRAILASGTGGSWLSPVAFWAHIALEAREAILSPLSLFSLEASIA